MINCTIINVSGQELCPTIVNVDDVIVVGFWSALLSYGLITNLLTFVGIWRSKSMRKSTSYWLILSVAYCDIMMIIISMTHLMPATLLHNSFVAIFDYRNKFAIFLYNVFWYSGVVQLAGMALNRYVNIVHPSYYRRLFTPCYMLSFLGFMYTVGVAVSLPALFPCCYTVYDHQLWLTYYENKDSDYYLVDMIINSLSLAVMIVCYSAILLKVRKSQSSIRKHKDVLSRKTTYGALKKNSYGGSAPTPTDEKKYKNFYNNTHVLQKLTSTVHQPSKREMKLLTQFVIVSVVFLLTFFMWQCLFKLPSDSKWIYFTTTTFFFINNAVNPTVYLIYNTTLRKELSDLFLTCFLKRHVQKSTPIIGDHADNENEHENNSDQAGSVLNLEFGQDDSKVINPTRFANLPGVPYYLDKIIAT